MLRVGLTGGVACGKTTVANMFAERGAHLVQADQIARDLMQPGTAIYERVVAAFGPEILRDDRTIDRARLGDIAFGQNRIAELNSLVHPEVLTAQEQWMHDVARKDPRGVAMVEAALILEAGARDQFDKLITVTCTLEQKIARFSDRQGMPLQQARIEVERRMAAQMPEQEKIRAANYVIDNSGNVDVLKYQVDRVWHELKTLAIQRSH